MTELFIVKDIQGKLQVCPLEVKSETELAIILKQKTVFPDGSHRLILSKNSDLPTSPQKAIDQFKEGCVLRIQQLESDLSELHSLVERSKEL